MFRCVLILGLIQLGIAYVINFVLSLFELNIGSNNWVDVICILLGAQFFSMYSLKKNPNFFEEISRKRLSFLTGIFNLVITVSLFILFSMQEVGGFGQVLNSIRGDISGSVFVFVLVVALVVSYFLAVGLTYWGLGMGRKIFINQQEKLKQKQNS